MLLAWGISGPFWHPELCCVTPVSAAVQAVVPQCRPSGFLTMSCVSDAVTVHLHSCLPALSPLRKQTRRGCQATLCGGSAGPGKPDVTGLFRPRFGSEVRHVRGGCAPAPGEAGLGGRKECCAGVFFSPLAEHSIHHHCHAATIILCRRVGWRPCRGTPSAASTHACLPCATCALACSAVVLCAAGRPV